MNEAADAHHAHLEPPDVVRRYQNAHDHHDTDRALAAFAPDARVVDEEHEFRGTDQIRSWLDTAARQFTYTRTLVGAEVIDTDTWLVVNHLEGDFPGGVVDLQYRFVVSDDLILELVIAP
jgi:ketosteroid isomerase-like protein